jgi:hypothetical protein
LMISCANLYFWAIIFLIFYSRNLRNINTLRNIGIIEYNADR